MGRAMLPFSLTFLCWCVFAYKDECWLRSHLKFLWVHGEGGRLFFFFWGGWFFHERFPVPLFLCPWKFYVGSKLLSTSVVPTILVWCPIWKNNRGNTNQQTAKAWGPLSWPTFGLGSMGWDALVYIKLGSFLLDNFLYFLGLNFSCLSVLVHFILCCSKRGFTGNSDKWGGVMKLPESLVT